MGLTSSGDIFCARTDEALAGIPGVHKLVDDILVCGETKEELMERVIMVMERCKDHNITLSAAKAQVGQEVKFAGWQRRYQGRPSKGRGNQRIPSPEGPHKPQVLSGTSQSARRVLPRPEAITGAYQAAALRQKRLRMEQQAPRSL